MSTTLNPVRIGLEGVNPGLWLLDTTETLDTTLEIGFLNSAAKLATTKPNNKDFLLARTSTGSEYYTISLIGGIYTLLPAGGSAGGFQYTRTFWQDDNGDDDNVGSIDAPLKTLEAFIDRVAALEDVTEFCVLNVPGPSRFSTTTNYTMPTNSNIFINAPSAFFQTTGTIGLFRGTGGSFKVVNALLQATGQRLFTWGSNGTIFVESLSLIGNIDNDSGSGASMRVSASFLNGNISNSSNNDSVMRIDNISGNIVDTSGDAPSLRVGVFARHVGGNISSTQSSVYGQVFDVSGSVSGIRQGTFAGVYYSGKYSLPDGDGTVGQVITTDGSGTSTWEDIPTPP